MSGGITVKEFKHIPGVNDAEYIEKLKELREIDKGIINAAVAKIKKLSAQLKEQPKHGKWIPHSENSREYIGTVLINVHYDYWFCDTCGYRVKNGQPMHNFFPNCGADMRKRGEADVDRI